MNEKQNLFPVSAKSDEGIIQIKAASSPTLKTSRDILVGVEKTLGGFLTAISAGDITALPAAATIADGESRLFFLFASVGGELNWSYIDAATTGSEFGQVSEEILEDRADRRLLAIVDIHNASGASFVPATTNLDAASITFDVYSSINVVDFNMSTADIADAAVTNVKLGGAKIGVIQETVAVADFTDNEDATGTIDLSTDLPAGAIVLQSMITGVVGFAGDTSAVVTIGDGSDVDRYNTGTPNVFATAANISAGAVSGTAYNATAVTPNIIVTGAADFTSIVTDGNGAMTITIFYFIAA